MKTWFETLSTRERYMVIVGGAALFLFVLYLLVISPILQRADAVQARLAAQQSELAWMRQAAAEIQALRGQAGATVARGDGASLLSLIERTARSGQLAPAVRRVQPDGEHGVRIWLENAAFDDLLRWLHQLSADHGIALSEIGLDRQQQPGRVNARLFLESGV